MTPCAAAIALLLDASGSILPADWALQVGAHASAFETDAITRTIEREPVAVTFSIGVALGLLLGVVLTICVVAGVFWAADRAGRE